MGKLDEVNYLSTLAAVHNISIQDAEAYHIKKSYSDPERAQYLMDISQILKLLPAPPLRLLDVGAGSGWTSKMFALYGYNVVGIDISPDMINLAKQLCKDTSSVDFWVTDYELGLDIGEFEYTVIHEALHHADAPGAVIKSIYSSLVPGGVLVTVEPGRGHAEASQEIMRRYGKTEKDMEFEFQNEFMRVAGFSAVKQYPRLSVLPWIDISTIEGEQDQGKSFQELCTISRI
ncbi:MAG: class I SAM-dependent methyltransferase [Prochlorococcaceae cyanobacterium]|jgi:SAM-dependent methyltransferase